MRLIRTFFFIIYITITEILALLIASATYFMDLTKHNPKIPSPNHQTPILLIHGYLHGSSGWLYHRHRFKKEGFESVFTINLGSPFATIEHHAETVQKMVEEIAHITGQREIILIGHSMGGLVASYYASEMARSVTHVITLGSPLEGSFTGYLNLGKDAVEMRYRSPFIMRFREGLKKINHVKFLHIGSYCDELVIPASSAIIKDLPHHENVQFHVGHVAFLYSPHTFTLMLNHLKHITSFQRS